MDLSVMRHSGGTAPSFPVTLTCLSEPIASLRDRGRCHLLLPVPLCTLLLPFPKTHQANSRSQASVLTPSSSKTAFLQTSLSWFLHFLQVFPQISPPSYYDHPVTVTLCCHSQYSWYLLPCFFIHFNSSHHLWAYSICPYSSWLFFMNFSPKQEVSS